MIEKQERLASKLMKVGEADKFDGYTIEELRFRKAVVDVKRTYIKEKMQSEWSRLVGDGVGPLRAGKKGGKAVSGNMLGKVMKVFSYTDYIAIGIALFKGTRKVISLFKKKS
jgi:hypothetical protein